MHNGFAVANLGNRYIIPVLPTATEPAYWSTVFCHCATAFSSMTCPSHSMWMDEADQGNVAVQ